MSTIALVPKASAEASVVEKLEELVERTKAGEFTSFYIVGFRADGAWATMLMVGRSGSRLERVGALESLKHDALTEAEDDGAD